MIVNAAAQPAKTRHRLRSKPGLGQGCRNLHPISRDHPDPGQTMRSFCEQRGGKCDMAIFTRRQSIVADYDQAQSVDASGRHDDNYPVVVWNMPASARSTIGSDSIMRALSVRNHSASSSGVSDAALRPCRVVNR